MRRVSRRVASAQAETVSSSSDADATLERGRLPPGEVAVAIEKSSFSSRRLVACTSILAPPELVWEALTDYEGLGDFIPSLVENRCLEKRERGAVLYQVGAQDVALGVKFRAACTLEITEHPRGILDTLCTPLGDSTSSIDGDEPDNLFPMPTQSLPGRPIHGDITFDLLEGDFEAFRGVWRIQPGLEPGTSWLIYSLYVRPQSWLPVALIQHRIRKEIVANLKAVQQHSEQRHQQRCSAAATAATG